ncbi:MAG: 30S ribosomal protein S15 [Acholeplasmatales bacterium]|nr:30S ribosomal protein S15 [Acholeplasmatales bacterium]
MALTKEQKAEIVKKYGKSATDTGSVEVQIALLTAEINELNEHFNVHIHDFHSKRGLMCKIGHRKSLMNYLKKNDPKGYDELIQKLGLRK